MPLFNFKRRSALTSLFGVWMSEDGELPPGYHRLLDAPEIGACVNRITGIVSICTLYLMQSGRNGDKRLKGTLSRFVDIDPWPNMATGQSWKSWIVSTLLTEGDGNAFVLPRRVAGRFTALEPMPGAMAIQDDALGYRVSWKGREYAPDEVLHFRLFADSSQPWKGRGYQISARRLADSLAQSDQLRASLGSPKYKPPMIVSVNSDSDFFDDDKREALRKRYLEDTARGKPWILPGDLIKVETVKPMSLNDLAVKDTLELDKKAVAAIFGVPAFLLGLGSFSQKEYNNFIHTVVEPICKAIETELTLKLLSSEDLYFAFNRRRLYSYDLESLIKIDCSLSDRGFINGDEVREDAMRDPVGLTEYKVLENYIPWDMSGSQSKLKGDAGDAETDDEQEP
ncbi:MAG: phage portal protein [Oscillospiraceae bacterium]|nr:phage portal protein [Oscillospiraceae bacterium]